MIIIHVLEPFASGITTAVSAIAGELKDFDHIVIHGSRNWTESSDKVKQRFVQSVSFIEWKHAGREISLVKDLKALNELKKLLKPYKNQKDRVVHLHSSKAGFLGRLACRMLNIKEVIYTPHCGAFLRTDISSFKRFIYKFFERLGGCFGGRVVGCGKSEGEIYKKLGKNTTFVPNGVAIKNNELEIKNKKSERKLISFSGIASFQKDPALWNKIASSCAGKAREKVFSFCWIGDGPLAQELDKNIINVTGWKTEDEVQELLEKTAVYFSTSAWEGLPYGVLEAMNCGCALLLRNVPGNRELVIPGENGWLFDTPEEACMRLEEMINNMELLSAMGEKSTQIIKSGYSIEKMGEGYRKIYLETQEIKN